MAAPVLAEPPPGVEAEPKAGSEEDAILTEVKRLVLREGCTRAQEVARRVNVRVEKALAALQELERLGWLSPGRGPKPRELLLSREERRRLLRELGEVMMVNPGPRGEAGA